MAVQKTGFAYPIAVTQTQSLARLFQILLLQRGQSPQSPPPEKNYMGWDDLNQTVYDTRDKKYLEANPHLKRK